MGVYTYLLLLFCFWLQVYITYTYTVWNVTFLKPLYWFPNNLVSTFPNYDYNRQMESLALIL